MTLSAESLLVLWDLRAVKPIFSYNGHINRRENTLSAAFSPCMKYIAVPSEDRSVRILDIRKGFDVNSYQSNNQGSELFKIMTGQRDIVSTVAYNPLFAQLAIGSYDGTIKFFIDPNQTIYS